MGVRRDDPNADHGYSGTRTLPTHFDRALDALRVGNTSVITTIDGLHDRPRSCSISPKTSAAAVPQRPSSHNTKTSGEPTA